MVVYNIVHDVTFCKNNELIELNKISRVKSPSNKFSFYNKKNLLIKNKIEDLLVSSNRRIFHIHQKIGKYSCHHKLHAYSVVNFIQKQNIDIDDIYILVNDGGGWPEYKDYKEGQINEINAECISLYRFYNKKLTNIFTYYNDFENKLFKNYSPSIMYLQSCLSLNLFLGEEGKILALESLVTNFNSTNKIKKVQKIADKLSNVFMKNFLLTLKYNHNIVNSKKVQTFEELDRFLQVQNINKKKYKTFDNKYIIAYFTQYLYEKIFLKILDFSIKKYNIQNLGGAGGGFFNVKLNNLILKKIKGQLIINPVPGDLGINYFRRNNDIINSYKNRYLLEKTINSVLN